MEVLSVCWLTNDLFCNFLYFNLTPICFFIIIHRIHSTTSHFWFSMLKAFYHHQMRVHNRICLWNSLQIWRGKWKIFENCESLRSKKFYTATNKYVMYEYISSSTNAHKWILLCHVILFDDDRKVSTRIFIFLSLSAHVKTLKINDYAVDRNTCWCLYLLF